MKRLPGRAIGDARRLYLTAVWDEAPHLLALDVPAAGDFVPDTCD